MLFLHSDKKSARSLHLIVDMVIVMRLYARYIEVVFLTPETVATIRVVSRSLPLLVGSSIPDEAMDVVRSAPQGAHYHADVIDLLP